MASSLNEAELFAQFLVTRSPALREKLVISFVSLVHYVLGRLGLSQEMGADYEDLVNQGLLGLIEAVDRYDASYGTQFSTYATVRIRGKVLDYLRSLDWLSRTARHRTRAVQEAINALYEKSQQVPTNDEIAAYLGLDEPKVQQALVDASRVIVSLDALTDIDQENDTSLYETLADRNQPDPADVVAEQDAKSHLLAAIKNLPEREQLVLTMYYYEELTLKEIGQVMGISESRVCQLHARAVMSLKTCMAQGELKKFSENPAPKKIVPQQVPRPKMASLQASGVDPPKLSSSSPIRKGLYV